MSKQLQLKIITPERLILDEMVDSVTLPTTEGEITILPDHIPLIIGLSSGNIVATVNSEHVPVAVAGGFIEVKKEGNATTVAVLADFAEHVTDITKEAVEKAVARIEELRIQEKKNQVVDFEHFASELERNMTRVKVADKWHMRKYRK